MDGQDLATLPPRERARRIAYIPQIHPPTFGYTVLDTVLMGAARQLNAFQQPGAAQIRQADEALEQVGAAHLRERNFAHLSGGEQQLVLIARALAQKAEVLMMDEPTSALDYGNQLRILQMVRRLAAQGYTVILSTHNPQHALTFATTLLALHGGTAAAWGPALYPNDQRSPSYPGWQRPHQSPSSRPGSSLPGQRRQRCQHRPR